MADLSSRPSLFVDSAGWMAMADGADPLHDASRRERDSCLRDGGILVTTDYVIDETLTLVRFRLGLRAAADWWAQIDATSRIRWERVDASRAAKAREWFFEWTDKGFAFTDCTSFVVMRELGLPRALTTDRRFSQAGFEVVPRRGDCSIGEELR